MPHVYERYFVTEAEAEAFLDGLRFFYDEDLDSDEVEPADVSTDETRQHANYVVRFSRGES